MRDLAKRLGVSHVTVSLALQNHPRISEARRKEIQALAIEMGYSADPMLSSLSAYRRKNRTVPVHASLAWLNHWRVLGDLRKFREFDAYWQGASTAALTLGYRLDEEIWEEKTPFARVISRLVNRGVRGILIPPHGPPAASFPPEWQTYDWKPFSVVRLGHGRPEIPSHVVSTNQYHSSATATLRIQELGYRRIAYVSTKDFEKFLAHRYLSGFLTAQRTTIPEKDQIKPLLLDTEILKERIALLVPWIVRNRVDAILTPLDIRGGLEAAGVRIPEDLGLAVTSILDAGADAGIDQNSFQVGVVAAQNLIQLIQLEERGLPPIARETAVAGLWHDGASLPRRV